MELVYEMRRDHLHVVVSGDFDAARARLELANILRCSATSGITRILVDARAVGSLVPTADRYQLATQLADQSQGRVRMAIVVDPSNRHTQTFEDTATNRGVAVRTTVSMPEAVEFLGLPPGAQGAAA